MKSHLTKPLIAFFMLALLTTTAHALRLDPTIYFVKSINMNAQRCSVKKVLRSTKGQALARVCAVDYKTCVIEGTCALVGSERTQIINYVEEKQGAYLFQTVGEDCPFGYGVKSICLDPYYTVAADLRFHKPGDVIFVDKVKGTKLPNGEIHDGYFIVRDRGGAIKGAHRFDFYTGLIHYKNDENPFTPLGLANASTSNPLSYRKATASEAAAVREKRKFPSLPL